MLSMISFYEDRYLGFYQPIKINDKCLEFYHPVTINVFDTITLQT